jgi:rubredoxin
MAMWLLGSRTDGVTVDDDFRCPVCGYVGRLFTSDDRSSLGRLTGGCLLCPHCANSGKLFRKRKYLKFQKVTPPSAHFSAAVGEMDAAVKRQFPNSHY